MRDLWTKFLIYKLIHIRFETPNIFSKKNTKSISIEKKE